MKNIESKGITLIALVITIIILLILAGISISALSGTGLFEKAKLAKEKTQEKEEEEKNILEEYSDEISKYTDGNKNGDIKAEKYYLYHEGNEYEDIAGEWWNNEKTPEYTQGKLEKKEKYMEFTAGTPSSYNPACTKTQTMDISAYDSINIEFEITEENTGAPWKNVGISILNENGAKQYHKTFHQPSAGINTINIGERTTISIDISEIENLDNVYFGMANNGYKVRIYSIYLAKNERKMLYEYGQEYTKVGGEWVNNPIIQDSETTAKLTKNSDHILFEIGLVYTNPICTKKDLMDITEYDKLKVEFEPISSNNYTNRNITLMILDSLGNQVKIDTKCGPYYGKNDYIGEKRIESIDISDLTNEQKEQVYFGISGNSYTFKIYRIWLEKKIKP